MEDYQLRVVKEKEELDLKRRALAKFKSTNTFLALSALDQELLNTQGHTMSMYSAVLGERISNFTNG